MAKSSSVEKSVKTFVQYCDLCDVKLENAIKSNQHLNGKKHKAKVAAKEKGNTTPGIKRNVGETKEKLDPDEHPAKKMKAGDAEESKAKVESEIPTKNPTSTLTCDDCDLVFQTESSALQHFKGKRHASKVLKNLEKKKAELKAKPECTICSKTFPTDSAALLHYQSKAHTAKLLASIAAPQPKVAKDKESIIKKQVVPKEKQEVNDGKAVEKAKAHLHCELCNMTFLSDDQSLSHFKGKKHNTKVTQTMKSKELEAKERSNNWIRNVRYNTGGYGSNQIGNKKENSNNWIRNRYNTGGYGSNQIENKFDMSSNYSNRNQNTQQEEDSTYLPTSNFNVNRNQYSYDYQNENKPLASNYGNSFSSQTKYNPRSNGYNSGNVQSSDPATAQLGNINNDILRLKGMLRNYESY